ncbi:MAG: threonine/serine exporter family protein [Eubacteriales bacterium]|nr:threonine/serine exporter family protein [Eubacteriales bacterium]
MEKHQLPEALTNTSGYYPLETRENAEMDLALALDIGERMLRVGAEIGRVEDSLRRICTAFGAERVDVFTITSSIVVTMMSPAFGCVTQTRRVQGGVSDFYRLHLLNALSRTICAGETRTICAAPMTRAEIAAEIDRIDHAPVYGFAAQLGIYALISAAFSLFFGGVWQDAAAAAVIGVVLCIVQGVLRRLRTNPFLQSLLCSFAGGLLASGSVALGLALHADLIAIGNVMLLIPGIALTNAIRDLFSGDLVSGLLRFAEALMLAATVALGFVLAARLFG